MVTNANFEHFWLNEGFTVFTERKIASKIGKGEQTRGFSAINGWKDLKEEVSEFGSIVLTYLFIYFRLVIAV